VDANVLAELVLAKFRPGRPVRQEEVESRVRGRRRHSPQERFAALTRLLGACCTLLSSARLTEETIHACQKQGHPVPRDVVDTLNGVRDAGKLQTLRKSFLERRAVPDELGTAFPRGDAHLIHLALAGGARWLLSDDRPVLEMASAMRGRSDVEIVDCTEVLERVPAAEAPCWQPEWSDTDR
jgi:hypothetical protein